MWRVFLSLTPALRFRDADIDAAHRISGQVFREEAGRPPTNTDTCAAEHDEKTRPAVCTEQ